jgi:hypothetical protein
MGAEEKNQTARRFTPAEKLTVSIGCAPLVAGVLLLALTHGTVASTIGICLLGVCGIAFVALMSLLVSESKDRHYRKGAR